jgi:hypothetical protein
MPRLDCSFASYVSFDIPQSVYKFLLKDEENKKANENTIGSWWVRYGVFYYVDVDGEVNDIYGGETSSDYKYPETEEWADEEDEEDEDKWAWDEYVLQLNHGNCELEGRHADTSDEDWALCKKADQYVETHKAYDCEIWTELRCRLLERDGDIKADEECE